MKLTLKTSLIVAVTLLTIASCKKNDTIVSKIDKNSDSKSISIKDGMLIFKDSSTFVNHYKSVMTGNHLAIGNFVSYKAVYDKAQEDFSNITSQSDLKTFLVNNSKNVIFNEKDMSISPRFGNPTLMDIMNTDGRFMIGDALQIVTHDDYITVRNPTKDKIAKALSGSVVSAIDGIVLQSRLMSSVSNESVRSVQNPIPNGLLNEATFYNADGKRRLFVQTWNEYIPSIGKSHVIVAMFQQKKGTFGGWSNNQTDLYFDGLSTYGTYFLGTPYLPSTPYSTNGQQLAYNWQNTTGPVYYELPLWDSNGGSYKPHYEALQTINIQGHFFSGGVPNTGTYSYSQN